jgi:hypothetical protein
MNGTFSACFAKATNHTTDSTGIDNAALTGTYIAEWPTKPGTYTVRDGVLTATPNKEATNTAINGGAAVTWP